MKLFDTWAWIEYFKGTPKGEKVKEHFIAHPIATSTISITELVIWARKNNISPEIILQQVRDNSTILPLDEQLLEEAGEIYVLLRTTQKDIGIVDAIIYTTAQFYDAIVITNDPDFAGLPQVEMV